MTKNDDKSKPFDPTASETSDGGPLSDHVSSAALSAAQGSSAFGQQQDKLPLPRTKSTTERSDRNSQPATSASGPPRPDEAKRRPLPLGGQAIADAPFASLVIAATIGLGLGWMLRGRAAKAAQANWIADAAEYLATKAKAARAR